MERDEPDKTVVTEDADTPEPRRNRDAKLGNSPPCLHPTTKNLPTLGRPWSSVLASASPPAKWEELRWVEPELSVNGHPSPGSRSPSQARPQVPPARKRSRRRRAERTKPLPPRVSLPASRPQSSRGDSGVKPGRDPPLIRANLAAAPEAPGPAPEAPRSRGESRSPSPPRPAVSVHPGGSSAERIKVSRPKSPKRRGRRHKSARRNPTGRGGPGRGPYMAGEADTQLAPDPFPTDFQNEKAPPSPSALPGSSREAESTGSRSGRRRGAREGASGLGAAPYPPTGPPPTHRGLPLPTHRAAPYPPTGASPYPPTGPPPTHRGLLLPTHRGLPPPPSPWPLPAGLLDPAPPERGEHTSARQEGRGARGRPLGALLGGRVEAARR
nr:basic proline-rich protein-like [Loxodonta africana]